MKSQLKSILFFLGFLVFALQVYAQGTKEWNQWRGPDRNGHSLEKDILKEWPENGPKLAWRVDNLGEGYSNFSFWGDKIFSMGDFNGKSRVFALSKKDGKMLWNTVIGEPGGGGGFPGPKCTPSTDGKIVIALNQHGDIVCCNAENGKLVWKKSLPNDFNGRVMSGWGWAESPLLIGNQVICMPGGEKGSVIALDAKNGNVIWRCTELIDNVGYTSIVPAVIDKTPLYLVLLEKSIAGVSPKDGKLLWRADFPSKTALCSDPVFIGNHIFAACSYGVGGYGYDATGNSAKEAFSNRRYENHHGGIVAVGDHYYMLTNRELVCIEAATGNSVWTNRSVGKGSILYVDGYLILRAESGDGTIALAKATPEGYQESGRFNQPDRSSKNSWTYPTVVDGKLYIRDQGLLLVYDVK